MGLPTAVELAPAVHDRLCGRLRLVHPGADDGKSNRGLTILDISSCVSTGTLGSDHQRNDGKFCSFGFDSKCTFFQV